MCGRVYVCACVLILYLHNVIDIFYSIIARKLSPVFRLKRHL